jgi:hypothetical protein
MPHHVPSESHQQVHTAGIWALDTKDHETSVCVVSRLTFGATGPTSRSLYGPAEDQILSLVWIVPEGSAPECGLCRCAVAAITGGGRGAGEKCQSEPLGNACRDVLTPCYSESCTQDRSYQRCCQAAAAAEVLQLQTSCRWYIDRWCSQGTTERLRVYESIVADSIEVVAAVSKNASLSARFMSRRSRVTTFTAKESAKRRHLVPYLLAFTPS